MCVCLYTVQHLQLVDGEKQSPWVLDVCGHWLVQHPDFTHVYCERVHASMRAETHTQAHWQTQRSVQGEEGGLRYSQKKNDSGVGHRISQSQNSTAHNGVAEIKDGHAKRSLPLELQEEHSRLSYTNKWLCFELIKSVTVNYCIGFSCSKSIWRALTSVKRLSFLTPGLCGRNSSCSAIASSPSNLQWDKNHWLERAKKKQQIFQLQ